MNETYSAVREILEMVRATPEHVATERREANDSFFRRIMERVNEDIQHWR